VFCNAVTEGNKRCKGYCKKRKNSKTRKTSIYKKCLTNLSKTTWAA